MGRYVCGLTDSKLFFEVEIQMEIQKSQNQKTKNHKTTKP
jgi:hypothetical protein